MKKFSSMSETLRLSPYAQPRLLQGTRDLTPQNLAPGRDRIEYLDGFLSFASDLLKRSQLGGERGHLEDARRLIRMIPFSGSLVEETRGSRGRQVSELEGVRGALAFDPGGVTLAMMNGLRRTRSGSMMLETGNSTAAFGRMLRLLDRGVTRDGLRRAADREQISDFDLILEQLVGRRLVGPAEKWLTRSSKAPRADKGPDSVVWLGHAGVSVRSGAGSVWVDPFMLPRIAWSRADEKKLFSNAFADRALMESYSSFPCPVPISDFPPPQVVCLTHQDSDHFDLGSLMMLSDDIPIVVPESLGRPWEVDMKSVIRHTLGNRRKVVILKHHESLKVGPIRITAFPFVGEMPAGMGHRWNCYFLETQNSAVACTADSAVSDEALEFLSRRFRASKKPLLLCGRGPHDGELLPGYRDSSTVEGFYNGSRLWAWYLPIGQLFAPVQNSGPSMEVLTQLRKRAGLKSYFAYAAGSTPWFRINDPQDLMHLGVSNFSMKDLRDVGSRLRSVSKGLSLFPAQYGRAVPLVF